MNSHLCLFYSQQDDRYLWTRCRTLIAEADSTTHWLYIADEHSTETIQEQLDGHRHGEVIDSAELAFRSSPIRIHLLLADLTRRVEAALNACAKVLLFVEMSWAIRTPSGAVYLREYEAAIEELSEQWPLTVVCLYNQQVMLDRQLLIGLHTHPVLVVTPTPPLPLSPTPLVSYAPTRFAIKISGLPHPFASGMTPVMTKPSF